MKYLENIKSIAALQPDYMGFIFYEKSERYFKNIIPMLPKGIKKTGVFVDEYLEIVISLVEEHQLEAIQLHGSESVDYIQKLKQFLEDRDVFQQTQSAIEIIKVFSIKNTINFRILEPFLNKVDYFLFDTEGRKRGGNGVQFDWSILKNYPFKKPFFLSGGIALDDVRQIKKIQNVRLPIHAVDINSKFEIKPGLKSVKKVEKFINGLAVE